MSRRLTRLEEKLGVQLIQRSTRRVTLTEVGAAYRERVTGALARLDEAALAVRERRGTPRGHLRVTAPVDIIGITYLSDLAAEFVRKYPESTVEVVLTDRMVDLVAEGIDMALRATTAMPDSSLVVRRISSMQLHLYATPAYLLRRGTPQSVAALAGHDFVLLRAVQGRGTVRLRGPGGEEESFEARSPVSGNDFAFVLRATLADAGIAVLPDVLAAEDARASRLKLLLPDWVAGNSGLFVVHPGARLLSANVRVFRDLVIERLSSMGAGSAPQGLGEPLPSGRRSGEARPRRSRSPGGGA